VRSTFVPQRRNKKPQLNGTAVKAGSYVSWGSRLDDYANGCFTRPTLNMAQKEGFEPPTNRLTADCSTTELLLNRSF
jgi:hypothetical protein